MGGQLCLLNLIQNLESIAISKQVEKALQRRLKAQSSYITVALENACAKLANQFLRGATVDERNYFGQFIGGTTTDTKADNGNYFGQEIIGATINEGSYFGLNVGGSYFRQDIGGATPNEGSCSAQANGDASVDEGNYFGQDIGDGTVNGGSYFGQHVEGATVNEGSYFGKDILGANVDQGSYLGQGVNGLGAIQPVPTFYQNQQSTYNSYNSIEVLKGHLALEEQRNSFQAPMTTHSEMEATFNSVGHSTNSYLQGFNAIPGYGSNEPWTLHEDPVETYLNFDDSNTYIQDVDNSFFNPSEAAGTSK